MVSLLKNALFLSKSDSFVHKVQAASVLKFLYDIQDRLVKTGVADEKTANINKEKILILIERI